MSDAREEQKALTYLTVHKLLTEEELPFAEGTPVQLDLDFTAGPEADAEAAIRALGMFGYSGAKTETGLTVVIPNTPFTAEAIWEQEDRCTRIVESRGFAPDGWGFAEP